MYHDYPTITYSKEPLLDKKLITDFLVNNQIQFEPVNNVYRDYEAYIRVNNVSPNFRQNNSPLSGNNQTVSHSPLRPYGKVDHSTNHFDKLRAQYSPVKNMITKKVARTSDNQMKNSFTGKKLNGRSRSEISNPLRDKSPEKSKNDFNPLDRSASIIGDNRRVYPQTSNGSVNKDAFPLNTMANVITNELKIFFEKNASVLKGESSASIKESIRKICTQTLQGFGLDESQEKIVLNQAMMNLENLLLAKAQNRPENTFQGPNNSLETYGGSPSLHVERVLSFGNNLTLGEEADTNYYNVIPNPGTLSFNSRNNAGVQNTLNSQYTSPGSGKMGTNVFESFHRYNARSNEDIPTPKLGAFQEDLQAYNELKRQALEDKYKLMLTTQGYDINSVAASVDTGSNLVITTRKSTEQSLRNHGSKRTEESDHWAQEPGLNNLGIDPRPKRDSEGVNKMINQTNKILNRKQVISQMIPSNPHSSPSSSLVNRLFDDPNATHIPVKSVLDMKHQPLKNRESILSNGSQSSMLFSSSRNESPTLPQNKIQNNKSDLKMSSAKNMPASLKQYSNPHLRQTNVVKMLNQKLKNQRSQSPSPITQRSQNESETKSSKIIIEENNAYLLSQPKSWNSNSLMKNNGFSIDENEEEFENQHQQERNDRYERQAHMFNTNDAKRINVENFRNLEKPANPNIKKTRFNESSQFGQRKDDRHSHSFIENRAYNSRDLSGSMERSNSPPANRSFVFRSSSPENEHTRSIRRKMAEERYNDYARRTLQKIIDSNHRKLEFFRDRSSDKKVCDFDKLSSSQILAYHKIIVQNSKFEVIDVLRKSYLENGTKQNLGIY